MKEQPINKNIFKEYDIRGRYPDELNKAAADEIARAYAAKIKAKTVVIGRNARQESAIIGAAFAAGLKSCGVKTLNLGTVSTPTLFFAIGQLPVNGGVMVTASHNPAGYTGLKLAGKDGIALGLRDGAERNLS